MRQPDVIITTTEPEEALQALEGRSFQVHLLSGSRLLLVPLSIRPAALLTRCPVILGGEQCADVSGHPGKHQWERGD
jgi:hypothetical protein